MTVLLAVTAAFLCACGTYLLLTRQLSRIIIGICLLGHGVNIVLVLSGGDGGDPTFVGGDPTTVADPLPQALVLTAIVITLGVVGFLLALAYRSWRITADDDVEDDVEDRRVAEQAHATPDPDSGDAQRVAAVRGTGGAR